LANHGPPSTQIRPVFGLEDKKRREKEEFTGEGEPWWFFFHSKKNKPLIRFFFGLDNYTVTTKKNRFFSSNFVSAFLSFGEFVPTAQNM